MEIQEPTIYREMECQICQDLLQMLVASEESPPSTKTIVLGSYEEALATDCQWHKPLVESFVAHCQSKDHQTQRDMGLKNLEIILLDEKPHVVSSSSFTNSMGLLLVNKSPLCNDHLRKGRFFDPMYMDLDILKCWLNECLTTHGTRCHNPMRIWHTHPAWLVDVKEMCLIPGDDTAVGSSSFVALSYRWGSQPSISVVPESMPSLKRPGILDDYLTDGWVSTLMTPMIRHAIYLTSVLGERYLWVDTLCIVHGDRSTSEQLSLMGSFYASAVVVIVAADGDARDGIAGLRGVPESRPREAQHSFIPFRNDETILIRDTSPFLLSMGGPYYNRGWTYQEYKMASRKIFFKDGLMHWECQCTRWHEDLSHDVESDKYIEPRLRDIVAGFPAFESLSSIIEEYNELDLRYEEDALPGILGLLSVFSRSFAGGFLYGIPETFFDLALGWKPGWFRGMALTRRKSSDRPSHLKFSAGLPSWSWVGWKGRVLFGHETLLMGPWDSAINETFPVTRWFTGSSPNTAPGARREIRSKWCEQRSKWKKDAADHALPLPTGWTRHEVKPGSISSFMDGPLLWPEECGGFMYKHKSLPDHHSGLNDMFFYPFPVPDITETTPPDMPEQTAYLFCTTQRARLWTRGESVGDRYPCNLTDVFTSMHDGLRDAVGTLQLHDDDQLQRLVEASAGTELGVQVEIVAINRVKTCGNTLIKEGMRQSLPQWTREEYTVLWIEWEGGVAYRNGVGSIEKSKWEQLDLEDVDLVLG